MRADDYVQADESYGQDEYRSLQQVSFFHEPGSINLGLSNYFFSSASTPATAERAISRMDLSALRIRKLVSRTAVIMPMMPPVVTTLSPAFNSEIVAWRSRCFFCCGLISSK